MKQTLFWLKMSWSIIFFKATSFIETNITLYILHIYILALIFCFFSLTSYKRHIFFVFFFYQAQIE